MRILLHGLNFTPELTGIGKYTGEMATWLAARGHQVQVVTAPPYYPDWKVGNEFGNWWTKSHVTIAMGASRPPISLKIYRCPLWVPPQPSGVKRLLHLASFALSSLPVMLRQILWQPDVVWVVEPALFCAPTAWVTARLTGAKAWLHIQDYEVDAAFDLGLIKGQWPKRWVWGAESWLMRRFDVVSTISQRMLERAQSKGVNPAQLALLPNWVDLSVITSVTPTSDHTQTNDFRTTLGITAGTVVALYSGNMGTKQGLELLAQTAALLAHEPNLVFVFCGNGAGRSDLVQRCDGLSNVHFLDLQPISRLNELLSMADIHLLPQRADAADLVMPSKLTGMLASGRPVLATAHPGTELDHVINGGASHDCCGITVPPEQPKAFSDALLRLAQDPHTRGKLGRAARQYAETHLHIDAVLSQFVTRLEQTLQPNPHH